VLLLFLLVVVVYTQANKKARKKERKKKKESDMFGFRVFVCNARNDATEAPPPPTTTSCWGGVASCSRNQAHKANSLVVYIYVAANSFGLLLLQESTEILLAITQFLNCFLCWWKLSRQNVVSHNALHGIFLYDVR
jgi:hypothetical protein